MSHRVLRLMDEDASLKMNTNVFSSGQFPSSQARSVHDCEHNPSRHTLPHAGSGTGDGAFVLHAEVIQCYYRSGCGCRGIEEKFLTGVGHTMQPLNGNSN